jgi:hypothetical protein
MCITRPAAFGAGAAMLFTLSLGMPRETFAQTAQRVDSNDGIRVCVQLGNSGRGDDDGDGRVRLIASGQTCRRNERFVLWSLRGPAGPAGPQGPAGPAGPTGPQGLAGAAGAIGPMGPQGAAGADGAAGPAGPQGLAGLTGPQGPVGPAGADGVVGPAGPQGPQGLTGLAGADGAIGPMGPQGLDGRNGRDGVDATPNGGAVVRIATAEQTADFIATRDPLLPLHWVPVPGAVASIELLQAGSLDVHAGGNVVGVGTGDAYCAFRYVIDGIPQGMPGHSGEVYGQQLVGVGTIPDGKNPYHQPWSIFYSTQVAGGPHVVSLEMAAMSQTCRMDAVDYARARVWVLGR